MTTRVSLHGGTELFVEPSHSVPLVSIVVALRTGNAHDPRGKDGLARIAMRMMRRGVEKLDARSVEDLIDRLGGEMAVDTGSSSVAIHAQVIARNVEPFCELLGRMLGSPSFPHEELERLKRETLSEIAESRDNDRGLVQKAFRRTLFGSHPYARGGAGTKATVSGLTLDDVKAFHSTAVTRSNLVVGFAGDVTEGQAKALTERMIAGVPVRPAPADDIDHPPPISGRRLVFVDKPERTQTQILIGGLGTWPHDADHVPLGLAAAVFGGTFTSRLMKEVRSKRGWSYGASARAAIDRKRHSFSMWTFPSATDAPACIALELSMWDALFEKGVSPKEVTFMQRYLVRSHAFDVDTAPKRLHQALDVELLGLPPDYYTHYLDRVKDVTAETASNAVRARLVPADSLVVVVGTAKETLANVEKSIPHLVGSTVIRFDTEDGE